MKDQKRFENQTRFRDLDKSMGLKAGKLADTLGLTPAAIYHYRRHVRPIPDSVIKAMEYALAYFNTHGTYLTMAAYLIHNIGNAGQELSHAEALDIEQRRKLAFGARAINILKDIND